MNIAFRRLALVTAAAVALSGELWGQAKNTNRTPADGWFGDQASDKIRSDGKAYYDGVECVHAWVDKGGFFFLRTVTFNCTPYTRSIVLDFTDAESRSGRCPFLVPDQYDNTLTLDICGTNTVPDVRVIADSLFKDTALVGGTKVTLPFLLKPSFNGRTDPRTVFELDFEQPVPVSGDRTLRVLEAAPTAVAELYQYGADKNKVSLGRYRMPFQLSVVKH